MFGPGRLDHLALEAAPLPAFDTIREQLLDRDATDGFATDGGESRELPPCRRLALCTTLARWPTAGLVSGVVVAEEHLELDAIGILEAQD